MYEYKVIEVTKVVDGDTVDVLIDLGFGICYHQRVRLAGIDAPESRTRNLEEKRLFKLYCCLSLVYLGFLPFVIIHMVYVCVKLIVVLRSN